MRGEFICLHGNFLLWVDHFLKGDSDWFTSFGVMKNATTSAYAAYDISFFMMLESVSIAPLYSLVLLKFWDLKKHGLLRDF